MPVSHHSSEPQYPITLFVRIDPPLSNALDDAAERMGSTRSAVARRALEIITNPAELALFVAEHLVTTEAVTA
jgi:predicted transcriptional regulator